MSAGGIREVVTFNLGMTMALIRDVEFLTLSLKAAVEAADELSKYADDKDALYEARQTFDQAHSGALLCFGLLKDVADLLAESIGYDAGASKIATY